MELLEFGCKELDENKLGIYFEEILRLLCSYTCAA
jgi:hypothetical protein